MLISRLSEFTVLIDNFQLDKYQNNYLILRGDEDRTPFPDESPNLLQEFLLSIFTPLLSLTWE
jgi:hypothetical protein